MKTSLLRLGALALGLLATLASADEPKTVRILSNWFIQPDQAGYWQAQQDKLGADAGIRITVLQGGPKIQTLPQVASGQAEFGIGNADDVLLARLRGAPVKAVFAHLDHVPYTFVYHADPAVKSIADLQGRTFAVNIGNAYWEWTKKQFKLTGTRDIPVSGDLSLFRNDPKMVQQGYSLFLPARMAGAGIAVQQITLASLGYRPYDVLFTTDEMIQKNPALVKATIAAVQKGWSNYVRNPSGLKTMMAEMNKQISPDIYDAANKEMIETLISHDLGKIGCMSAGRWTETAGQLRSVGFLPAGFDEKQAYDRTLVPRLLNMRGAVRLDGVSKRFGGGLLALDRVDFELRAGEFVSIVGPSGCGKSTLLRIVAKLVDPSTGECVRPPALTSAFVFQEAALLPWRSVERNAQLLMELEGVKPDDYRPRAAEALQLVGLKGFETSYPHQLSGGMRMRLSLARALALRPGLLLLDEPLAAVDELTRDVLQEELSSMWQQAGFTAALVTHNVHEAVFLSNRVVVMSPRPGRILDVIEVPFAFPRAPELRATPEFARLTGQVTASLRRQRAG